MPRFPISLLLVRSSALACGLAAGLACAPLPASAQVQTQVQTQTEDSVSQSELIPPGQAPASGRAGPPVPVLRRTDAIPAAESAAPAGLSDLRLSGFGTLGVVHAIAPEGMTFRRDMGQRWHTGNTRLDTDSRLGVQADARLGSQWAVMTQAVLRNRAPGTPAHQTIEWAMATWTPGPDWSVRFGRMAIDTVFLADFGSVGYAYAPARTPIEMYGVLPHGPMQGVSVTRSWTEDIDSTWRARVSLGRALPFSVSSTPQMGFAQAELGSVLQAWVQRESGPWRARLNVLHARGLRIQGPVFEPLDRALRQVAALQVPVVSAQAAQIADLNSFRPRSITFLTGGLQYESPDWFGGIEAAHLSGTGRVAGATSAYAMFGRRMGSWSWHVEASGIRTRRWDITIDPQAWTAVGGADLTRAAVVSAASLGSQPRQSSIGVGLRWDFHPQAALKLQINHYHVPANTTGLWSRTNAASANPTLLSALVDFVY